MLFVSLTSQLGRQLTELLELHSGEVSILVSERPKLREQASRVLSVAFKSLQTNTALPDSAVSDGLEILASLRRISGPELKTAIDEIEPLADQFRKRRLRTAVGVKRVTKGGAKKRN